MMKPTVYVETTVVSYLAAAPSRDIVLAGHQETTRVWRSRRDRFELFVSQAVVEEASRGNAVAAARRLRFLEGIPVLGLNAEVDAIANRLLRASAVPAKARIDAVHIAVAAINRMEYLGHVESHAHCECGDPWRNRADLSRRWPPGTGHLYS